MSNRHKWYKEIKAWADGAEIESLRQQVKTLEAKNKELLALCLDNSFEWSEPYDINYKVTLYGDGGSGGTGKMEETR